MPGRQGGWAKRHGYRSTHVRYFLIVVFNCTASWKQIAGCSSNQQKGRLGFRDGGNANDAVVHEFACVPHEPFLVQDVWMSYQAGRFLLKPQAIAPTESKIAEPGSGITENKATSFPSPARYVMNRARPLNVPT